ncbi:cklf-like marvel transmembrane domain-containing protein 4 [Plakobranchus ocellatus]|uniref:Cklf-like marvel transmembrane domain-containing protein 4 n=1 Tax=Plakobranchus ocellatus TaxID=259542 RepID=A0AAV4DAN8_9GAST|nr:cklf-like marvel transmembrane domain-containing protein 4 [Plakobranchus ocellatus]
METKAYEHTTETRADPPPMKPQPGYPKSVPGILKIAEVILCILVLICASVVYWNHYGGGWVHFVGASALVITAILFIFHFLNVFSRLPGPWPFIEFMFYCVYCLFWTIAAIVAAFRAPLHSAIGATAFFTFVALALYLVDAYFMYRAWKTFHQPSGAYGGAGVTTTTTTTTYETRTQY